MMQIQHYNCCVHGIADVILDAMQQQAGRQLVALICTDVCSLESQLKEASSQLAQLTTKLDHVEAELQDSKPFLP